MRTSNDRLLMRRRAESRGTGLIVWIPCYKLTSLQPSEEIVMMRDVERFEKPPLSAVSELLVTGSLSSDRVSCSTSQSAETTGMGR